MTNYLGYLAEGQRTNIVEYSNANTFWSNNGGATRSGDSLISPRGLMEATQVTCLASVNSGIFNNASNNPIAGNTVYTFSMFVKFISGHQILSLGSESASAWGSATAGRLSFDTVTGSFSNIGSAVTAYNAKQYPNGWWRVQLTATSQVGATVTNIRAFNTSASSGAVFGIWGVQLEAGNFASSFIYTSGAQVTRVVDIASVNLTAAPWFNPVEGTILVNAAYIGALGATTGRVLMEISDGTVNNRLGIGKIGSAIGMYCYSGGASQVSSNIVASPVVNQAYKIAFAYKANDFAACADGGSVVTDNSGALPVGMNKISIGCDGTGALQAYATLKESVYYPTRYSNAQLQALTT